MFKFNFGNPEEDGTKELPVEEEKKSIVWLPATEHIKSEEHSKVAEDAKELSTILVGDEIPLRLINCAEVNRNLQESRCETFKGDTDLIPGVYEGGLKIWEGAEDLVEFVYELNLDYKKVRET